MGHTERYEDRQKKQRKKEKKEQLDFFLLEKGRVLLKWRLSVGCDVYQMGWSKLGYSGFDKDREIEWRFVWLRTISFYHLFLFYFVSVCPNLNCEIACHSSLSLNLLFYIWKRLSRHLLHNSFFVLTLQPLPTLPELWLIYPANVVVSTLPIAIRC